jgi:Flp pilus assembly protein TadD
MVPSDAETEVLTPEPEPVEAKKAPAAHAAAPEPKLDMAKLQPYHAVAPHIDSKAAADLIDRAQTAMAQSDFAAASVLYDLALKQDDENREALLGKATATSRLGNYAGAAQAARHVLTLYPEDREARADLITALSLIASPKAVAELKKMAQATPNQAFLQAAVAQGLSRSGKPDQALPYQYRAATLEPQNILYRHALAVLYDRTGHMAEARDLYQEVLQASTEGDTHALPPDALNGVKARLDYLTDMLNKPQDVAMSDDKD